METSISVSPDRSRNTHSPRQKVFLTLAILAVVTVGVLVRLPPPLSPSFLLESDSAFHGRMIAAVMETGSLPDADPKYAADPLRDNRQMYPSVLHHLSAEIVRVIQLASPANFFDCLMIIGVIFGALTVLPMCAIVWTLTRRTAETVLAGALFAVATPVVLRSAFHVVRHETLSVFFLLTIMAIMIRWRTGTPLVNWQYWILLVTAGFFGMLGAGTWRLFPPLVAMLMLSAAAADFMSPRAHASVLPPTLAVSVGCLAAWPLFDYYRLAEMGEALLLVPPIAATGVYALLRREHSQRWVEKQRPSVRIMLLVVVPTVAVLVAGFGSATGRAWLGPALGLNWSAPAGSLAAVLVSEMLPVDFRTFMTWDYLSYLPALYLGWLVFLAFRPDRRDRDAFLGLAAACFLFLTLLFNRMVFLGLPLVLAHLLVGISRLDALRQPQVPNMLQNKTLRLIMLGAMLPLLAGYAIHSRNSLTLLAQPAPDRSAAYHWLTAHAQAQDRVAAGWSHGFELQWYTPAKTIMDGYLEDMENRRRIRSFTDALFATDQGASLTSFCAQHHIRYLLLDNSHLLPLSRRMNLPWREWFRTEAFAGASRVEVLPAGRSVTWLKLMIAPDRSSSFLPVFARGNLVIFKVTDRQPGTSAR
ncbi:MAG TPA: hypothetical protein PL039_10300 [Kiritimatiellia bacterium]|nr:hypothetical protein [Kiritimatiellia bacterium]